MLKEAKMSIKLMRTFLPVGQGACYLEEFTLGSFPNNPHFVMMYDCGSSTKDFAKDVLKKELENISKVDLLIISHFHEDHVNLLPYLKQIGIKVKTIWIPYYDQETKKALSFDSRIEQKLLEDPKKYLTGLFEGIRIVPIESFGERLNNAESILEYSQKAYGNVFPAFLQKVWLYIPYNYNYQIRVRAFQQELQKFRLEWDKLSDVNYINTHKKQIKKCYQKISSLNEQSLVVFSVSQSQIRCLRPLPNCCWRSFLHPYRYRKISCLFLGDYNAQDDWSPQLDYLFGNYQQQLGVIQVPHHGSRKNFKDKLLLPEVIYPVSFGFGNQYRHPSAETLSKILQADGFPILVSQRRGYKETFYIC